MREVRQAFAKGKNFFLKSSASPKDESLILPRKSVRGFVKERPENGRNAKQVCAAI
jgi:hypothetical protein